MFASVSMIGWTYAGKAAIIGPFVVYNGRVLACLLEWEREERESVYVTCTYLESLLVRHSCHKCVRVCTGDVCKLGVYVHQCMYRYIYTHTHTHKWNDYLPVSQVCDGEREKGIKSYWAGHFKKRRFENIFEWCVRPYLILEHDDRRRPTHK